MEERIFEEEVLTPVDVTTTSFQESSFVVIPTVDVIKAYMNTGLSVLPTYWPTANTPIIEWTYTVDLDRELFIINQTSFFPLSGIPDNWIHEMMSTRGPDCHWNDDFHLIDMHYPKPEVNESHLKLYQEANCNKFEISNTKLGSNVHEGLCFEMSIFFFTGFDVALPRRSLFILPCAILFTSSVHTGYQDIAYPATSNFWFGGVFFYLTTHLEDDQLCKAAIGHVLELTNGSGCPRNSFTAFLFSITDLVVVEVSEEGIKHTNALPFYTSDAEDDEGKTVPTPGLFAMITYLTRSRKELASHCSLSTVDSYPPYDVLMGIVEYVDWETAIVLSSTSKALRECVDKAGPKCGPFKLLKYIGDQQFIGRGGDGRLMKIDFEGQDEDDSNSSSSFATVIRYPGVKQRGIVRVINLTSYS